MRASGGFDALRASSAESPGGRQAWHKHHQVSQEFTRIFGRVAAVA